MVLIMRDKKLGDPVINRCISRQFRWNDGMEVMTLLDSASEICFQLCLPGFALSVYLGVSMGLRGYTVVLYWFHAVQLVCNKLRGFGINLTQHK